MNIVCAQCGAGVGYGLPSLADQTVVVCPGCRSGLRVRVEAFSIPAAVTETAPSAASPAGEQRHRAVVALQGEATRELIGELLSGEGFEVLEATTGAEALARVSETRPALVLVDVGLSDIMGFQVCETIRKDAANAGVKIILVAAIHNKDRYRRQPDHLFGADDYIERHQIETDLVTKVKAFSAGTASPTATAASDLGGVSDMASRGSEPSQPPAQAAGGSGGPSSAKIAAKAPAASASSAPPRVSPPVTASAPPPPPPVAVKPPVAKEPSVPPVAPPAAAAPKADDPVQEAARRLARIIVSDIALYNAKKVDEGVLKGTFFDLLRTEIDEGRRLYEERQDPSLQGTADLFQQTLEQFVATRRELLNRSRPAAA
ncbi:MAG: response regulator [Nitrospirota bacterium]